MTTWLAECFRETAIEKMRENDFYSGRISALEAQKLCRTLEDIDGMIVVCNVHCAAAEGDDLYKILGVAAEADESAVSSQCSEMALALHPDNNKSPGAAEAFQLFLKAKKVLLNNDERRVYDSTCRARAMGENSLDGLKPQQEIDQIFENVVAAVSSRIMNDPKFQPLFHQTEELMSSSRKNYILNLFGQAKKETDHIITDKISAGVYSRINNHPQIQQLNHQMNAANVVDLDHTDQPSSKDQMNEARKEYRLNLDLNASPSGEETSEEADRKEKRVVEFEPGSVIQPDSKILKYTELYDLEKDMCITRFGEGQVWAIYDTRDAMPRFYGLINSISDDQTIRITWLKPLPNNDDEKQWLNNQGFPASVGRFEHAHTGIQHHTAFSHLANHKRDPVLKNVHEIHPKKGETWAVLKNWDIERFGGYEHEVVKIMGDYHSKFGISVAFLEKIKGYCCVFGRKVGHEEDWKLIQVKDRLRFSHRIPSVSVTIDIPNDYSCMFQLDPASLYPSLRGR